MRALRSVCAPARDLPAHFINLAERDRMKSGQSRAIGGLTGPKSEGHVSSSRAHTPTRSAATHPRHLRYFTMPSPGRRADGSDAMAVDDTWTACFRDCCRSGDVNLAVPKHEFAGNLRQIHDGPASAVYLGRFGDKAIAVKKPKLPTKVRGGDVSIASHLFLSAPTRRAVPTTHRVIEASL